MEPSPYELYLPEGAGPFPLICLTPILGRLVFLKDLFFEKRFAQFFASRGFAAALIDRPIFEFNPYQGLRQIQNYLEESVQRNKKVLDVLVHRIDIDPEKIGSFGMSFGAVVNSLWAAMDPRLRAHVLALAGGNIPEIILTSRDPLMRNYLKAIIESRDGTEDLEIDLQNSILWDPLNVCPSISRENIFLLLGIFDRVIRFRYGLDLWKAMGKPKTYFLPLGHYGTILAVPFLKGRVLKFFRQKLRVSNPSRGFFRGGRPARTKLREALG